MHPSRPSNCELENSSCRSLLLLYLVFSAKHLKLPAEESVVFCSLVEERSMKRRASKLIPLVSHSRAKTRHLVLTSNRLLCVKQRQKPQELSLKFELSLKASEKIKDKDKEKQSRGIIHSVQRKGDREFVVLTVSTCMVTHTSVSQQRSSQLKCTTLLHLPPILSNAGSTVFKRICYCMGAKLLDHGLDFLHA